MPNNKVLITKIKDRQCVSLMEQDRIARFCVDSNSDNNVYPNGTIVIGRVEKIVSGINAAFLSLGSKEQYFMALPKKNDTGVLLVNRPYNGQIKCGDEIVVQVTKQPIKLKQAIVDYKLSFAGQYCLLENHQKGLQISSKLPEDKRSAIKNGFESHDLTVQTVPEQTIKVIVRTNADFASDLNEIYKDYELLKERFEHLLSIYKYRPCFSVLYESEAPYIDFIRNIRLDLYDEIVSDNQDIVDQLKGIANKPVRLYDDLSYPLVKCYSLESKLDELLHKKVWLKSGGFLVIEQGETLTAIDVNSGKSDKKSDLIYATNLEAVKEIFLQIKARNISGMILIDFINMNDDHSKQQLIQAVKEEIKNDYVRTQYIDITGLGLMELTREKKLPSLQEIWYS